MPLMKALVAHSPETYAVERIGMPAPGPEDVLVQVHGCTICGSDIKLLDGNMPDIAFPLVPGHEWSGTVVGALDRFRHLVGSRVVSDILQSCGGCEPCRRGHHNLCTNLVEPGLTAQGAFAEFIAVPGRTVHVLPDALDLDVACLVEPLSVVLYALQLQPPQQSSRILVLGGGGIGLLTLAALRTRGHDRIVLIDPHAARRELARLFGAIAVGRSWSEDGAVIEAALQGAPDLVYNAASSAQGFLDAVAACRPGGRIALIGYSGLDQVPFQPSDLVVKLLDIRGALSPTYDWKAAIALLASGTIEAARLLTHRIGLAGCVEGIDRARRRSDGAIRVMVVA